MRSYRFWCVRSDTCKLDVECLILSSSTLCRVCRRRSIEAGKHVLVEFPLALSHDAAVSLYDLADKHSWYFIINPQFTHMYFLNRYVSYAGDGSVLT